MKYPEFLKQNGKIGFIAPSFASRSEPYLTFYNKTLSDMRSKGFLCIEGPNTKQNIGIGKSNTADKCGEEINDFFCKRDVDVIISTGGGETMCEDLNFVDFDAIAASVPHWYVGFSDNTNLTFTLPTLCDIAAIYGPNAAKFGELDALLTDSLSVTEDRTASSGQGSCFSHCPADFSRNAWQMLLGNCLTVRNYTTWELESLKTDENPFAPLNATEPFALSAFVNGCFYTSEVIKAQATPESYPTLFNGQLSQRLSDELDISFSGRLIGGCLDCLVTLAGTTFDKANAFAKKYKNDGILWFIEACDLSVIGIRRALWQLDNAGWFENASGFLFGRPMHYNEGFMGADRFNSVIDILGKYNVPIIFDLDIGHIAPQMPIISGAIGNISVKGNSFALEHKLI